jgi:capsular polysaccharide biosynthesis protein
MRTVRDEGSLLIKELEAAQRAYDSINQRRSEVAIESKSDTAAARVLTPAVAPLYPEKPKPHIVMAAAGILGLLLGIGGAIGLEMMDRRVRSADDLAVVEGVPVLAVLSAKPASGMPRIGTGHDRMLPPPPEPTPRLTMSEGT